MRPDAGGLYTYIRDAFGPLPAFLYGWASFVVIASGSVATLAVAFSGYLGQLVPLALLLGFAAWQIRRRRQSNREARRLAELQHEISDLQRKLHRSDLPPREYFADASRAVQLKAAVIKNLPPHAIDADTAAAAFRADEGIRQRLQQLFARSDELRYSGTGNGASTLSADARREVLDLLDHLRA